MILHERQMTVKSLPTLIKLITLLKWLETSTVPFKTIHITYKKAYKNSLTLKLYYMFKTKVKLRMSQTARDYIHLLTLCHTSSIHRILKRQFKETADANICGRNVLQTSDVPTTYT